METGFAHVLIDAAFIASHPAIEVLDPVYWSVDISGGPEAYEASLAPFSSAQRLALGVLWYEAEVNNGGHDQFYWNSTGIVWRDALAGFGMLELPAFAAILNESAARLGGDPPLDREARQAVLDGLEPRFDDLDDRFFALERAGQLTDHLAAWMRAHPDAFAFEGVVQKPIVR